MRDELFDLTGRRILVTGAGGGIGSAAAQLLSKHGAELVLIDVTTPDRIIARVGDLACKYEVAQIDISDRVAVEQLVSDMGPFSDLVDCAAIYEPADWMEPDWDDILDRVIACNIKGPINLSRAVIPAMQARGGGRIVMLGSVAGHMGGIRSGPDYAFTKGGIHAFSKWLARRLVSDKILVNVIAPGPVKTPMTDGKGYDANSLPLGRMAQPEEIAATVLFLLSPGMGYSTGAIFDINGGAHYR